MLKHSYNYQGVESRIILRISRAIIDFLGKIYVDNTGLIITRMEFRTRSDTLEGLRTVAWAWALSLNATSGMISLEKSQRDTLGRLASGDMPHNWICQWKLHSQTAPRLQSVKGRSQQEIRHWWCALPLTEMMTSTWPRMSTGKSGSGLPR